MSTQQKYLGIDLGTSSVKLLVVDGEGRIMKLVSKKYPVYFPKALWSEQNPKDWWEAVKEGIAELAEYRDAICAISFSGQMHGLVILNEKDEAVRPAILWNDQRTQIECDYLNGVIGRKRISGLTGNIALTGFTATKLLWLRINEPHNFKSINKVMLPKDFIVYMLSGVFATDVSDASGTLYFDVKNRCWSKEMIKILDIEENKLPQVFESYEVIGRIKPEIAAELGLRIDTKIIIGGGDQAVGAVGTGTVKSNECFISLGTSGVVFLSTDEFSVDDKNALHSFCHANGRYHLMGVILSAAGALQWWVENICGSMDYNEVLTKAESLSIDDTILFLPYLMGERTPVNNPNAKGVFIGMNLNHRQEHMTLAVLEGVIFALRDTFEILRDLGLNIQEVKVTSGGSKCSLWLHLISDILRVKVSTVNTSEGPALGAAILAMVGEGKYASVEEACNRIVKVENTINYDEERAQKYNQKYIKYRNIYPSVKHLF